MENPGSIEKKELLPQSYNQLDHCWYFSTFSLSLQKGCLKPCLEPETSEIKKGEVCLPEEVMSRWWRLVREAACVSTSLSGDICELGGGAESRRRWRLHLGP